MAYAPVYPHGTVEEIGDDIFMVRGSIKMNPLVRITRNMAIVRNGEELSLIDPIRVNDEVERQLTALGEVKHLIRLGALHGIDDPYYVDKFKAQMWSQPGGTVYTSPSIDVEIANDTALPFPNAELLLYEGLNQPEGVMLLKAGSGMLITCDSIQHYGDYSYNNLPARMLMPFIGFPKTTLVGPVWLKLMTPPGGNLEDQLRRVLNLQFERLLSAHGTLLEADAHAAVARAIDTAFARA